MTRARRLAGFSCVTAAVLVGTWVLVTWLWQEPFTALYTSYQQHRLTATLRREFASYRLVRPVRAPAHAESSEGRIIAIAARRFRLHAHRGEPLGRIIVPRMRLDMVFHGVSGYRIVSAHDLAVLRSPDHELLELQACEPRSSATHRYIVYALPVRVVPRGGRVYSPPDLRSSRALAKVPKSVRTTR